MGVSVRAMPLILKSSEVADLFSLRNIAHWSNVGS